MHRHGVAGATLALATMLVCALPASAQPGTKQSAKQGAKEGIKQGAAKQDEKPSVAADSFALARQYTQWFYTAQVDSLWAHHSEGARKEMGSARVLEEQLSQLTERAGTEVQVLEEKFVKRNGRRQYWRTAKFSQFPEPLLVRWVLGDAGEIMGMGLGPASQAPPTDPPAR
ncbi:MAG: hypothetical protein WKG32_02845 [Gemmatimonadaceae bacterium]